MPATRLKSPLMSGSEIDRTLVRLAHEVVEKNETLDRLAGKIEQLEGRSLPVGSLDITLYRDDRALVGDRPVVNGADIPFEITGKDVILVDDVLYTGRTTPCCVRRVI